jgi:hypothetical protein
MNNSQSENASFNLRLEVEMKLTFSRSGSTIASSVKDVPPTPDTESSIK